VRVCVGVREIQWVYLSARMNACMCVCVLVRAIGDNVWLDISSSERE
jgi:hypothetical protein